MRAADYAQSRAINWSSLSSLATSPLSYRWRLDHPSESSPSQVIGSATHCLILEPEAFASRYAVFDGTRRGKQWDEWQAEHPGTESLKPHEHDTIATIADAVRAHPVASAWLTGGRAEEVLEWREPETGLACKGRPDYIAPDGIVELKTARDVSPRAFGRAAATYLYHGQVAWYHDGAIAAGVIAPDAEPPRIVAVQTDEPYDCAPYWVTGETLELGRQLYRGLLRRLVECTDAAWWPGVAPQPLPLDLPRWATGDDEHV